MRNKLLSICVLLVLCIGMHLNAQTTALTENFENGLPSTWSSEPATAAVQWSVSNSGLNGVSAFEGTNYAWLYTTIQQPATRLVMPLTDISALQQPSLSFYLMQKARSAATGFARDTLRVYARSNASEAWTLLETMSDECTTWTRKNVDLANYLGGSVQVALEFVYGGGMGLGIDFVSLRDALLCYTPIELKAFNVTSNSAELMWTAYDAALQYNLKVSSTHLTNPATATANVFDQAVFYKPYAVTGLTPSTTYYYYVSADCGNGDESGWSQEGVFTTRCAPVALPYSQDFEYNSDFLTCWATNFQADGDWTTAPNPQTYTPTLSTAAHNSAQSLALYAYHYHVDMETRSTKSWAVSPEFNTTTLADKQVSFHAYCNNIGARLHVGVITDPDDISTFDEVAELNISMVSNWEEFNIPLNTITTTGKQVCFMVDGSDINATYYFYIDDVVVEDVPLCPKAAVVRAENVTDNSASIYWLGTAQQWNVKVSSTPMVSPDSAVADVLDTVVAGAPFQLNGLTSKTHYYVYIQPDCSGNGNGVGQWVGPLEFTTAQSAMHLPYFCDFEDPAEVAQWDFVNGAQTNAWTVGTATNAGGTHAMYISSNFGAANYYSVTATSFTMAYRTVRFEPGSYIISFNWKANGESSYDLLRAYLVPTTVALEAGNAYGMTGVNNNDPQDWISLSGANTKMNLQATWQQLEYNFVATDTVEYNLVFFWKNDYSSGEQPPAAIDNVTVASYTCGIPTGLHCSVPTATSFNFLWTPSQMGETAWDVQVIGAGEAVVDTTVTTTTFTVNGLTPSTTYTVRVRSNCGNNDVSLWSSVNVTTACGDVVALPFYEPFTVYGISATSFPTCWTLLSGNSSYISANDANNESSGSLYLNNGLVATPNINIPFVPLSNMQLEFQMASMTTLQVIVGLVTDLSDATSFIPVDTVTTVAGQWSPYIVLLSNITNAQGAIAFKTQGEIYLDAVELKLKDACQRPTDVTISNITTDEATVTWQSDASVNNWELVVVTTGLNPDSAALTSLINVATTTYQITGLNPSTSYDVYVRSACGSDGNSAWVGQRFTTKSPAARPPYMCGFEETDADVNNWELVGSGANQWMVGANTYHSGSQSMYVSDDMATNHYVNTNTSYAYAYRNFVLPAGNYQLSFDWKGYGESNYDYLRAFLVPMNGIINPNGNSNITYNTQPATWTAIDGGKLNLSNSWQTVTYQFSVAQEDSVRLLFYWYNDFSDGAQVPAAIDNVSLVRLSGCLSPAPVNTTSVGGVTTVTWSASDSATYHVKVSPTVLNVPATDAAAIDTMVSVNTLTLSTLQPTTTYHVYVQSVCPDGNVTVWEHVTFTTPCAAVSALSEDFESIASGLPACWTAYDLSSIEGVPAVNATANVAHSGTHTLRLNGYQQLVVTPAINMPLNSVQVNFWLTCENLQYSGQFIVGYMSNAADPSSFVPVQTLTPSVANTPEEYTVSFANSGEAGTGYCIAFKQVATTWYWYWLDDVEIGEFRQCSRPTDLAVSNLSTNGATVQWSGNSGSEYTLILATSPVNPDSVDENSANVAFYLDQINDNYIDLTGELSPSTTYYAYVRSDCGNGELSLWSVEFSFSTLCAAQNIPYVEHFNHNGSGYDATPSCWSTLVGSNGTLPNTNHYTPYIDNVGNTPDNDNKVLSIYGHYAAGGSNTKGCAIMPQFNADIDTLMLTFWHESAASNKQLLVGLMSDPSDLSTFSPIDTAVSTGAWQRKVVRLGGYNYGNYIAFMVDGDLNQSASTVYIDSVAVEGVRSCMAPLNLRVNNVTGTTVDVNMQTVSAADTQVNIQLTNVFSGNDVNNLDTQNLLLDTIVNVADLPFALTGLTPLTTYYLFARVACGGGNFSARYPDVVSFTTACGVFNVPFAENFNNVTTVPQCWSFLGNMPQITTNRAVNGKSMQTGSGVTFVALPEMAFDTIQRYELSMACYADNAMTVEAGVMTHTDDTTTFVSVGTYNITANSWQTITAPMASYNGNGTHLAFRTSGAMYVDDVNVGKTNPCPRPTALTVNSVDTTSAIISWTAGASEANWDVVYGAAGINPDNLTPQSVTIPSVTLAGLTPGTRYDCYVRAFCGGSDGSSSWSKISFSTMATAQGIPYTTGFENAADNAEWEIVNVTGPNVWHIGQAVGNPGTSLYITSDGGASNNYNIMQTSRSFAYRKLQFSGTDCLLSFDWRNQGENNYDYFRVYIAPLNTNFTTIGTATTGVPTNSNFIAVDGGTMHANSATWQNLTADINGLTGDYYLVFAWCNDNSFGTNPSAAIDNISIREKSCYASNISVQPGSTSAIINANTDCPTVQLQIASSQFVPGNTTALLKDTVVTLPATIGGLNPLTTYYVAMRGFCVSGDTTQWTATKQFATLCGAVTVNDQMDYTESFDGGQTGQTVHPDCWTTGTNGYYQYPYISSTHLSGTGSLFFYSTATTYCYGAMPEIVGTPINNLRVTFNVYTTSSSNMLEVGVMTNPADINTFVAVDSLTPVNLSTWEQRHVDLSSYTGTGSYVAIRSMYNATNCYVDNVVVSVMPNCVEPGVALSNDVANGTVVVDITPVLPTDNEWEVIVTTGNTPDTTGATWSGSITSTHLAVPAAAATTYRVYVRTLCSDSTYSEWTMRSIVTPCAVETIPYTEDFEGNVFPPTCWERYYGWLGNGGLTFEMDGWKIATNNFGLSSSHAKVNIYSQTDHWLITPQIVIDTVAMLSLDLALTAYGGSGASATIGQQADDRFVIVASRDDGQTWTDIVGEWNNTGSSLVFDQIPTNGSTYQLPLTQFMGETIRLGFYAESSAMNGDNDLHLDNINITVMSNNVTITDTICSGFNYTANGFNIGGETLVAANSPMTFNRLSADTIYVLTLYIIPESHTEINATICRGDTYTLNGFNTGVAGTYNRNLTSVAGCDSIVTLNLSVVDGVTHQDTLVITDANLLPYVWNGQSLTTTGDYVWNGTTAFGCDSIEMLHLDVMVGLNYTEESIFTLSPNPVSKGGSVRLDVTLNEAERQDMMIELFTSNGKLISRIEPKEQPYVLTMPEVAGLYMVRLTTGTGRIMYGKVIVK